MVKLIRHLRFNVDDYRLGRGRHDMPTYGWEDIKAPLDGAVTPAELEIFDQSLERYIAEVFVDPKVDQLYLVTHPHRNHLLPEDDPAHYPVDVRERGAAVVARSPLQERIVHIDFTADFAARLWRPAGERAFSGGRSGIAPDRCGACGVLSRAAEERTGLTGAGIGVSTPFG